MSFYTANRSIAVFLLLPLLWGSSFMPQVFGQSNYASHANNVEYRGEGLPEEATLDGKVSKKKKKSIETFIIPIAN